MKKSSILLHDYLTELWPSWHKELPELLGFFQELSLQAGEILPGQRGDIYLVTQGLVGHYSKNEPQRYIIISEIIIIPTRSRVMHFKALAPSNVVLLERTALYQILERCPSSIILYDELLFRQQEYNEFRMNLLTLPKAQRLNAFRLRYGPVIKMIQRRELAEHLQISIEYLRRNF